MIRKLYYDLNTYLLFMIIISDTHSHNYTAAIKIMSSIQAGYDIKVAFPIQFRKMYTIE